MEKNKKKGAGEQMGEDKKLYRWYEWWVKERYRGF